MSAAAPAPGPASESRLARELARLYRPADALGAGETLQPAQLQDARGHSRALMLELARPAEWAPLAALWQGVQRDLGLPAPAMAVNGVDGLQLWFSLAEAVPPAQAQAFLDGLSRRYLAGLPRSRLGRLPGPPGSDTSAGRPLPAVDATSGCWSAFVAPDLAPLFAETPWLDVSPGQDGQADLLARVESIRPAQFEEALVQLHYDGAPLKPPPSPGNAPAPAVDTSADPTAETSTATAAANTGHADALRFLQSVMNDESAPLALRIEAAKALLPYTARG